MTVDVLKYDLADYSIFNSNKDFDYYLWIPDKNYIVLGRSNKPELALNISNVNNDNIKVYKRPSGGQTVVLSPKTLVISVKTQIAKEINTQKYFSQINQKIIDTLSLMGVQQLAQKGISDISIRDKKILGSSIYLRKHILFYHAVLNICESPDFISKYLKHPGKEPDYRKHRSHKEFITSLFAEGYAIHTDKIITNLNKHLINLKHTLSYTK